jgi:hypothetical protein
MSLQKFQSALAYVIRFYDVNKRESLDQIFVKYELTNEEKHTLTKLAQQQQLKSYSEEMHMARWRIISDAIGLVNSFVDSNKLKYLWEHDFEPKHLFVTYEDISLKFIEYLATDTYAFKTVTRDAPDFVADIIKYLHCVFSISHNYLPKLIKTSDTILTDKYFSILDLKYDVRDMYIDFLERKDSIHPKDSLDIKLDTPPKRNLTLLFITQDVVTEFRSFEICKEVKSFLLSQLRGEKYLKKLPSFYDDLVRLKICQDIKSKEPSSSKIN